MAKRRCQDCAHQQPCGIQPRFRQAWQETFHHLGEDTGTDGSLVTIMDALASVCVHFETARPGSFKVLPINSGRKPR